MFETLKNVTIILSGLLIISVFIYSININNVIDSFKGLSKSYNKPITIMAMFYVFVGLFYGLAFYAIFFYESPKNSQVNSEEYIRNYLSIIIYFTFYLVIFYIFSNVFIKKYKKIMFSAVKINVSKKGYYFVNIIFLFISGMVFMISLVQNLENDLTSIIILISLGYFLSIFLSGLIMSIHHISNLKKYKFYVTKPEYFKEMIESNHIVGYLICEDNDEYIIRTDNQPAMRIKKSLVDIIQPIIDETEAKRKEKLVSKLKRIFKSKKAIIKSVKPELIFLEIDKFKGKHQTGIYR